MDEDSQGNATSGDGSNEDLDSQTHSAMPTNSKRTKGRKCKVVPTSYYMDSDENENTPFNHHNLAEFMNVKHSSIWEPATMQEFVHSAELL